MKKQTNEKLEQWIQLQIDKETRRQQRKEARRTFYKESFKALGFLLGIVLVVVVISTVTFTLGYELTMKRDIQKEFDKYLLTSKPFQDVQDNMLNLSRIQVFEAEQSKARIEKAIREANLRSKEIPIPDAVHPKYDYPWFFIWRTNNPLITTNYILDFNKMR